MLESEELMNWNKELLEKIEIENIENLEEKKKVAERIAEKVSPKNV